MADSLRAEIEALMTDLGIEALARRWMAHVGFSDEQVLDAEAWKEPSDDEMPEDYDGPPENVAVLDYACEFAREVVGPPVDRLRAILDHTAPSEDERLAWGKHAYMCRAGRIATLYGRGGDRAEEMWNAIEYSPETLESWLKEGDWLRENAPGFRRIDPNDEALVERVALAAKEAWLTIPHTRGGTRELWLGVARAVLAEVSRG